MTRVPTSISFLDAVTGHVENSRTSSADRPIRLAAIDPAYDPFVDWPGPPPAARVTFEGEDAVSGKAYTVAQGFIPRAGQRVWMVPIGNSYLISGAVNAQTPQGFWQSPSGADSGVELGGGSYFDTWEGLVLETDAAVAGGLTVAGAATVGGDQEAARFIHAARILRVPETQQGKVVFNKGTAAAAHTEAVTFPTAWPTGTEPVVLPGIATAAGGTSYLIARAQTITNTGFNLSVLKSDAALANFTLTDFPVQWVAFATPASF